MTPGPKEVTWPWRVLEKFVTHHTWAKGRIMSHTDQGGSSSHTAKGTRQEKNSITVPEAHLNQGT